MDDLFRLFVLRNPAPADKSSVDLAGDAGESPLLAALAAAQQRPAPQKKMHDAALAFAQSREFLPDVGALDAAHGIAAVISSLRAAPDLTLRKLAAAIESAFGEDARSVVASPRFAKSWRRLRDSIVAVKLAPEVAPPTLPSLVEAARVMTLVRRVAAADATLDTPGAVASALGALLVLPPGAVPPAPAPAAIAPAPAEDPKAVAATLRAATDAVANLRQAIEAVRAFSPAPEPLHATSPERAPLTMEARSSRPVDPVVTAVVDSTQLVLPRAFTAALPEVARTALSIRGGEMTAITAAQAEIKLLDAYKLTLADAESEYVRHGFHDLTAVFPKTNIVPVTEPGEHDDAADPSPATMTDVPKTHGTIEPAGLGDLLVTRQHTVRYEFGEMAHVENVARGEALVRETRRLDSTETTVVQETETIRSDQRDLQTTSHFDLHQEAEQVVKSDQSRIPGQPSSESYGSLVESGGSKSSSAKDAETYARDVTSRSATQLTQRVRTQLTTRVLRELEEKATHSFASAAAAEVIVYQWVDRVVQAQVFTYGTRLFYDIVIPEPAAFLVRALESRPRERPLPPRPAPFTLKPTLLNEWNWDYYMAGYGASGVTPPPQPTVTVARTFSGIAQNPFSDSDDLRFAMASTGLEVPIPEGYQATKVKARIRWSGWFGYLDLVVGTAAKRFVFGTDWYFESNLAGETGAIPITVMIPEGQAQYTLAIEVICDLTEERMTRWQAATHAAILSAARDRLGEYDQQLASLRASLRLLTSGTTAERKQRLVREEIEKACLEVMTNQHFDGFSAVEHSPQGFPQSYLPNIGPYGRYLRFLEHAFEWGQMTWRYAPYFWGRKPYWIQAVLRDDPDPDFADFLQSGAVRVLLPVRRRFEPSVLAFMTDGTVPTLDALSDIVSPLYLPILQELRDADTALDEGKPYGNAWEFRVPTTLVALRRDGTFPRWKQQLAANGTAEWVAVAGDPVP